MNYPEEILPGIEYKQINCDLSGHFLLRFVETSDPSKLIDPVTEKLSVNAICSPREHIQDLSMNLLGIFKADYMHLAFHKSVYGKFMEYCDPDTIVDVPIFEKEFYHQPNRAGWYIDINQLHNKLFSYQKGNQDLTAICRIIHSPMRWNYWHFSIRWTTDQNLEDMDLKQRNNVAQKIGFAARVQFASLARMQPPDCPILEKACYCKN